MAIDIPDKAELLAVLKRTAKEPLPFAFGIGKDAASSALIVKRNKQGNSLLAALRSERSDIKKGAFGTAQFDGKIISLRCDKEASGLARLVKAYLRSLGLRLKVRLLDPDGAVLEEDGDDEAPSDAAPNQPPAAAGPTAPTQPQAPGRLESKLVAFQKCRLIWESSRKKVAAEIAALKRVISHEFGEDDAEACQVALDALDDILENFDETLTDRLDALLQADTEAKREKCAAQAKAALVDYLRYLKSNDIIKNLDGDNPLGVKLSIASTLSVSLQAIGAQLK